MYERIEVGVEAPLIELPVEIDGAARSLQDVLDHQKGDRPVRVERRVVMKKERNARDQLQKQDCYKEQRPPPGAGQLPPPAEGVVRKEQDERAEEDARPTSEGQVEPRQCGREKGGHPERRGQKDQELDDLQVSACVHS